jgi:hypothetical protein
MQNEITHLKRDDNVVQPYQYERHVQQNFINRGYTNQRNEEHEPRTPRLQNPNVVMLEEIKEEYFIKENEKSNQELVNDQNKILGLVQMEKISYSFEILDEKEKYYYIE